MSGFETQEEDEETEKWVLHYSSCHQILLVGEGDFSFSLSLAQSFGSAFNITATSLDLHDNLTKKYKKAKSNLKALQNLGASIIHGVDATKLKIHTDLKMRRFDRIVYNFPHAGFHGKEDNFHVIKKHRGLVHGFFYSARGLLRPNGEIHVSHKTSAPFCNWNLEELASQNSLILIECAPFRAVDYPGYNNKRGDGFRCDEPFPLGECSTFKFILVPGSKKMNDPCSQTSLRPVRGHDIQCIPPDKYYHSEYNSVHLVPRHVLSQMPDSFREECVWLFDWYFTHVRETFGQPEERIYYYVQEAFRRAYQRSVTMDSGRPLNEFTYYLEEIHRLSISRIHWLKGSLESIP